MLIRLDFLGDAWSDEDYNDVITVQMSEICAVSLQRARYRSQCIDIFREVFPDEMIVTLGLLSKFINKSS